MCHAVEVLGEIRLPRVNAVRRPDVAAVGELPVCCNEKRLEFLQPTHRQMEYPKYASFVKTPGYGCPLPPQTHASTQLTPARPGIIVDTSRLRYGTTA